MTDDLMKSSGSGDAGNSTHADEQRLYPKVRFRGFDESWRTEKLKNIGESFSGLSGKKSSDFGHGEAKYITYLNILNNPIIDTKLTDKIEIDNKQHLVKKGDIFFTISSETPQEVGLSSVLDTNLNECYLNSFSFGYRLKEISMFDNLFNSYNFRSPNFRRKMYILAQGISRYNISKKAVLNETICFPKISEQKQIGKLIKLMNSLLSLQQRKLELEKQIFYALKTHIFAKDLFFNGQKDMIKYKLKDVSNMYQPETITATQMSTNGYKVFGANGYIGHYYNFNHKDDAITICARGASTGAVNFVPGPVWITGNSMVVDIDSKLINQLYFYYYLTTLNLKKYITGGAQPQLTKEILNGINVNLIPINIQIKVANILVLKLSNFLCK
ncbi:restriction endonuclease subunit S [Lactobacillus jensenii]|jgi:restriction endonuclease S subunit|uniref:restriction endonuclease subunit S n=2 Tax=Lactobacillus jensenii TaxID=109790 RepID=UPI000B0458B2|nr:restriction endonuclease subunit S [Lactobacillus jensenii]